MKTIKHNPVPRRPWHRRAATWIENRAGAFIAVFLGMALFNMYFGLKALLDAFTVSGGGGP